MDKTVSRRRVWGRGLKLKVFQGPNEDLQSNPRPELWRQRINGGTFSWLWFLLRLRALENETVETGFVDYYDVKIANPKRCDVTIARLFVSLRTVRTPLSTLFHLHWTIKFSAAAWPILVSRREIGAANMQHSTTPKVILTTRYSFAGSEKAKSYLSIWTRPSRRLFSAGCRAPRPPARCWTNLGVASPSEATTER